MSEAAWVPESPVPELPPKASPAAIRAALVEQDRVEFTAQYQAALAEAATTFDLTPVLAVLRDYHRIAVLTRRAGAARWQRMLATADEIQRTGTSPTARSRDAMDEVLRRRLGNEAP
ncbi:hypothetical protein JOF53_004633 [Crossiella equi]|uniref:Terminase small subunit n=1 Tax=Crossiella equi TaxID=130796 RepID=A0ABS5AHD4_9PSEU|nr:DUF6247 family protein [Crossiella equi]MBP2475761.1 hypothetical protein [Crossiella equi]